MEALKAPFQWIIIVNLEFVLYTTAFDNGLLVKFRIAHTTKRQSINGAEKLYIEDSMLTVPTQWPLRRGGSALHANYSYQSATMRHFLYLSIVEGVAWMESKRSFCLVKSSTCDSSLICADTPTWVSRRNFCTKEASLRLKVEDFRCPTKSSKGSWVSQEENVLIIIFL